MPFAATFLVRLRYAEVVSISTAGSSPTATAYTFRLNSLYDPNYTATGHQPYQYDQLTGIYNNYLVSRADFKVRFRDISRSSSGIWVGASVFTDTNVADSASGAVLSTIREKAVTRCAPFATQDNKENWNSFTGFVDIARAFGISSVQYNGDLSEFAGVYNGNPTRTMYLELFIVDPNSGSSQTTDVDIEIIFHAKMWGYKGPAQS